VSIPETVTPSFAFLANDPRLTDLQRQLEERKIVAQAACENANTSLQAVADVLKAMVELRDWVLMEREFDERQNKIQR
jgi:hypothetical protein